MSCIFVKSETFQTTLVYQRRIARDKVNTPTKDKLVKFMKRNIALKHFDK